MPLEVETEDVNINLINLKMAIWQMFYPIFLDSSPTFSAFSVKIYDCVICIVKVTPNVDVPEEISPVSGQPGQELPG